MHRDVEKTGHMSLYLHRSRNFVPKELAVDVDQFHTDSCIVTYMSRASLGLLMWSFIDVLPENKGTRVFSYILPYMMWEM